MHFRSKFIEIWPSEEASVMHTVLGDSKRKRQRFVRQRRLEIGNRSLEINAKTSSLHEMLKMANELTS